MATIYYWAQRASPFRIGHLSMELDDGTYISHWPGKKSKLSIVNKSGLARETLAADIEAEKGDPNEVIKVPAEKINTTKIKKWWMSLIEKGTKYNLWAQNCAQMVIRALCSGGLWTSFLTTEIFLMTPYEALNFIKTAIVGKIEWPAVTSSGRLVLISILLCFCIIIFIFLCKILYKISEKLFLYVKRKVDNSNVCTTISDSILKLSIPL